MSLPVLFSTPSPSPAMVRVALQGLLDSQPFKAAPRLSAFLRFVVEAVLAGNGVTLKGYTIGVSALGRPETFNPNSDPIVRVEAVRLRAALKRYYDGEGINDPVEITMPPGTYVPTFRWITASTEHTPPQPPASPASEVVGILSASLSALQLQLAQARESIAHLHHQTDAMHALAQSVRTTMQICDDLIETTRAKRISNTDK